MGEPKAVTEDVFLRVTKQEFHLLQELLIMFQGLQAVLLGRGLIQPQELVDALARIRAGETMTEVAKAIANIQDAESIEHILKDLEGPIQ